jgi:hypothetical protein
MGPRGGGAGTQERHIFTLESLFALSVGVVY